MATGSSSDFINKAERGRGRAEVVSIEPKVEAFVPRKDHNPRELKSWAKRTGFVSTFSGETVASSSGKNESAGFDLERGFRGGSGPLRKLRSIRFWVGLSPVEGLRLSQLVGLDVVG